MSALQIVALVIGLGITVVAVALFVQTIAQFVAVFRLGQPEPGRTDDAGTRAVTLVREFLGHTRMARLPLVAAAHGYVMVSYGL
jgi:hypothetical protein